METVKKTVYLASYKAKGNWVDRVIRFFDKATYSHSELVVEAGGGYYHCYSSSPRDGGVRLKTMPLNPEHWDLIPVNVSPEWVHQRFEQTKGKRYDFFGAIGIVLPIKHSKSKYFCSEWCAEVIGFHRPNEYSPEQLSRLLRELGYVKVV